MLVLVADVGPEDPVLDALSLSPVLLTSLGSVPAHAQSGTSSSQVLRSTVPA